MTRAELVKVADDVAKLLVKNVSQVAIAAELKMSQARVSQLHNIRKKCSQEVLAAWADGSITTLMAVDLSRLSHQLQLDLLNKRPTVQPRHWAREVAAESKVTRRPYTRDLLSLVVYLEEGNQALSKWKTRGAIAAIQHSIGHISREKLLAHLQKRK